MKRRTTLLAATVAVALGVLTAAQAGLASAGPAGAPPDLYWPDRMGTHQTVTTFEDHMCVGATKCDFVGTFSIPNFAIGDATPSTFSTSTGWTS